MSKYNKRLQMVKRELIINLNSSYTFQLRELVYHYFCKGRSYGIEIVDLLNAISELKEPYDIALKLLEEGNMDCGFPPSTLKHGQIVEVVENERSHTHTPRKGSIIDMVWHQKERKWYYFISSDGRAISKRYSADDLVLHN